MANKTLDVITILGGKNKLPLDILSRMSYIKIAKIGLTKQNFESLRQNTALDVNVLASLLSITSRTIQRKKITDKFKSPASEKMLSVADLYAKGYEVFGNKTKFQKWMNTPIKALGGKSPIAIADTRYGMELIEDVLGRIQYGVIS